MGVIQSVFDQVKAAVETAGFVVVDEITGDVVRRLPVRTPPVTIEIESIDVNEELTDSLNSVIGLNISFTLTVAHGRSEPERYENIENLIAALLRVQTNTMYRPQLSSSFTVNEEGFEITEINVVIPTFVS